MVVRPDRRALGMIMRPDRRALGMIMRPHDLLGCRYEAIRLLRRRRAEKPHPVLVVVLAQGGRRELCLARNVRLAVLPRRAVTAVGETTTLGVAASRFRRKAGPRHLQPPRREQPAGGGGAVSSKQGRLIPDVGLGWHRQRRRSRIPQPLGGAPDVGESGGAGFRRAEDARKGLEET